jgi:predicted tellurium resistance membrane protein TerC
LRDRGIAPRERDSFALNGPEDPMDFIAIHVAFLTTPEGWAARVTLIAMEVVLGIDNLIFISIERNPTIVMLALGFLLMIGTTLVADGFGFHVPKGYIYAAMAFSALVEGLNMLARRRAERVADADGSAEPARH